MKKYFVSGLLFAMSFVAMSSSISAETSSSSSTNITASSTCISLTKDLSKGQENSEVSALQQFLFDGGYLKQKPNGYFGVTTVTAVKKFQIANGVSPVGSVGPQTRGKVKEVSCKKIVIQNTSSTTPLLSKQNSSEISKVVNLGIYESKEVADRLYGTSMTPYFQENDSSVNGEKFETTGILFSDKISPNQEIKSVDVITDTVGGAKAYATFIDGDVSRSNKELYKIQGEETVNNSTYYTILVNWTPNLIDFEKTNTLMIVILFKDNKIQKIPLYNLSTIKNAKAGVKAIKFSAVAVASTTENLIKARNAKRLLDLTSIGLAIEQYLDSNNLKLPTSITSTPKETCIDNHSSCEGMIETWLAPMYLYPAMPIEPGALKKNGSGYLFSVSDGTISPSGKILNSSGKTLIVSAQYAEGGRVIKKHISTLP